ALAHQVDRVVRDAVAVVVGRRGAVARRLVDGAGAGAPDAVRAHLRARLADADGRGAAGLGISRHARAAVVRRAVAVRVVALDRADVRGRGCDAAGAPLTCRRAGLGPLGAV